MSVRKVRPLVLTILLAHALAPAVVRSGDQVAVSAEQAAFFESKIRPLLSERCWECHNEDVQESKLRLDSLAAVLAGGERGPALIPGKPAQSLLILAVNHSEADLQMPEGDKLSAAEIDDLTEWVRQGAPWPGQDVPLIASSGGPSAELFTEEQRNYWAFQIPQLPPIPAVSDPQWIKSDIDRFILAKLDDVGIRPAPPADKRTLIRRVYFDLIGLPPTPNQIARFLQDKSDQAFERVVDELLASPRYGERWGRHWLDVARYADSNGLDENVAFEYIYKYRDWVIQAFNDDLPFDRFVLYQIAGDLIPQRPEETPEDYIERVKAVGFLSVGPKMIADDDPMKKKMDVVDEQLNTLSQAFMGLTIGCARCHDHKFDPIPTWDYYAMAGILKSTRTLEHLKVVAPIHLRHLKPSGYDKALAAYESRRSQLISAREDFLRAVVGDKWNEIKDAKQQKIDELIPEDQQSEWKKLKSDLAQHEKTKPKLETVMAVEDGEPEDLHVLRRGNYLTPGEPTRRQFLRIIVGDEPQPIDTSGSGRLELAQWLSSDKHPLTARVIVNRIWRWRFGRGIVGTPDNFGRLGESPTHPDLLDWLAVTFVEKDKWSIKRLHKRMVLSSTYQMSSQFNAAANDADPSNRLWWRFPRKRLEAEAIRDAILYVSENLDLQMGGSLMQIKDRAYVTGTASKTHKYDNQRRSVYQPVYRSSVYDFFSTFDFPDPATLNGDRKTSVIAPQALLLMNSELVEDNAARLARTIIDQRSTDQLRVRELFQRVYGRSPTNAEIQEICRFVKTDLPADDAEILKRWISVCRAIIASSEFLYVE